MWYLIFSKINVYYVQTNYNEVAVLQQGAGKVTGARKFVKISIHMRDIEMSGKMKRLKRKLEVQKITFNYFARPQQLKLFYAMMMMAIQKILLSGFKICCGCMGWPGWEWDFPAWSFVPVRPWVHRTYLPILVCFFWQDLDDKFTESADLMNESVLSAKESVWSMN